MFAIDAQCKYCILKYASPKPFHDPELSSLLCFPFLYVLKFNVQMKKPFNCSKSFPTFHLIITLQIWNGKTQHSHIHIPSIYSRIIFQMIVIITFRENVLPDLLQIIHIYCAKLLLPCTLTIHGSIFCSRSPCPALSCEPCLIFSVN